MKIKFYFKDMKTLTVSPNEIKSIIFKFENIVKVELYDKDNHTIKTISLKKWRLILYTKGNKLFIGKQRTYKGRNQKVIYEVTNGI